MPHPTTPSQLTMPVLPVLTPWQQHVANWQHCELCNLHQRRQHVVLGRGCVPCDMLFIGEAPGPSEDSCGQPFVGPAGQLLDQMIERAIGKLGLRLAWTNLIACIPLEDESSKFEKPPEESIRACKPRIKEFIELAQPRLVVAVGAYAEQHTERGYKHSIKLSCQVVSMRHPAALLRYNVAQRTLEFQRCVVMLKQAVEDHLGIVS